MQLNFFGALTLLFIGLKLGNVIAWSWLWVLSPLWILLAIGAAVWVFSAFFAMLAAGAASFSRNRRATKRMRDLYKL